MNDIENTTDTTWTYTTTLIKYLGKFCVQCKYYSTTISVSIGQFVYMEYCNEERQQQKQQKKKLFFNIFFIV